MNTIKNLKEKRQIEALRCVYCREKGVSREHVIADQLLSRIPNDAWIIKNGSCDKCQKIINIFETDVIRNNYKGIRVGLNIKKDDKYSVLSINGENISAMDAYLLLEGYFEIPSLLKKEENKEIKIRKIDFTLYDPKKKLREEMRRVIINQYIGEIVGSQIGSFMKILAKIAYGFCIFTFGEDFYRKSKLPEIIIKNSLDKNLSHYIGSITNEELNSLNYKSIKLFKTKNHLVELMEVDNKIIAKIDLFCEGENKKFSHIVVCGENFESI